VIDSNFAVVLLRFVELPLGESEGLVRKFRPGGLLRSVHGALDLEFCENVIPEGARRQPGVHGGSNPLPSNGSADDSNGGSGCRRTRASSVLFMANDRGASRFFHPDPRLTRMTASAPSGGRRSKRRRDPTRPLQLAPVPIPLQLALDLGAFHR
jgi:hypothetical protein